MGRQFVFVRGSAGKDDQQKQNRHADNRKGSLHVETSMGKTETNAEKISRNKGPSNTKRGAAGTYPHVPKQGISALVCVTL